MQRHVLAFFKKTVARVRDHNCAFWSSHRCSFQLLLNKKRRLVSPISTRDPDTMFACKFYHILNLFEISVIHSTTENNTLHGKIAISLHQRFCKLNKVKTLRQNMQNQIN